MFFGTLVYFKEENFKIVNGKCNVCNFVSESGCHWSNQFCKICATKLISQLEIKPGHVGVGKGTFNRPTFKYDIVTEVFIRFKAHFVEDVPTQRKSKTINYYSPKNC